MSTLGSLLVQDQVVSVTQIEQALQRQVIYGGDLFTNLLELRLVDEARLADYAARAQGLPVADPEWLERPDRRAVAAVPWATVKKHGVFPVGEEAGKIRLAVSERLSGEALQETERHAQAEVVQYFAPNFRIAMAQNRYFGIPLPPRMLGLQKRLAPDFEAGQAPQETPPESQEAPDRPVPDEAADSWKIGPGSEAPPAVREPLDPDSARERLRAATSRDEILDLLMEFAAQIFDFAVLFVVYGNAAAGRSAIQGGRKMKNVESLIVPLDRGGMFQTVFDTRSFHLGPLAVTAVEEEALQRMGRSWPRNCAILPVTLRHRVILMLYGDSGERGVNPAQVTELVVLTRHVSEAFERILVQRKHRTGPSTSPPAADQPGPVATESSESMADWAGRYHLKGEKDPGQPDQPHMVERISTPPKRPSRPPTRESAPPQPPAEEAEDEGRPSALSTPGSYFVQPGTGDSVRRSRVVKIGIAAEPRPRATAPVDRPGLLREILAVKGDRPTNPPGGVIPGFRIAAAAPAESRSVVVEMREEVGRLVERVLSVGTYDEVAADLLVGIGEDGLRELMARFPGPLVCDRYQEAGNLRPVAEHGPLLRTVLRFGEKALPHLIPLLDSVDSDVRFYATYLFSELRFPDALHALNTRLFDNDRQIRAIAIEVLRGFRHMPEYGSAISEVENALANPKSNLDVKRIAASALGDLHYAPAIGALIDKLGSTDRTLADICYRSLVKITFADQGVSEKRWRFWWNQNGGRHPVEWAIEALGHGKESIRNAAMQELRSLAGDAIEWPEAIDVRKVRELQIRLIEWWKQEG